MFSLISQTAFFVWNVVWETGGKNAFVCAWENVTRMKQRVQRTRSRLSWKAQILFFSLKLWVFLQVASDNWARNVQKCSVIITVMRTSYYPILSSQRRRASRMDLSSSPIFSTSRAFRKLSWIAGSTGWSTLAPYSVR